MRTILTYILCFFLTLSSFADTLYWQISNADQFDYAILCVAKTKDIANETWTVENGYGDSRVIIRLPNNSHDTQKQESIDGFNTNLISTDLGSRNWKTYSFFVELYRYDTALNTEIRVNASQSIIYNELSQLGCIYTGTNLPTSNITVWQPMICTPEPNTGYLFLIGMCILLLRRKYYITTQQ